MLWFYLVFRFMWVLISGKPTLSTQSCLWTKDMQQVWGILNFKATGPYRVLWVRSIFGGSLQTAKCQIQIPSDSLEQRSWCMMLGCFCLNIVLFGGAVNYVLSRYDYDIHEMTLPFKFICMTQRRYQVSLDCKIFITHCWSYVDMARPMTVPSFFYRLWSQ